MSFGERLRQARSTKGFTQKQLAEQIGAKHNSISDWENNKNKPGPDTIELLCGVLQISPNFLLRSNQLMVPKYRLRQRREELGLTLEAVAKIVGVTRATVQKYENGTISNIPSDKIELLAKVLRTTPSHLMGWDKKEQSNLLEETPTTAGGEELTEDMKRLLLLVQDADEDLINQLSQYADFLKSQRKQPSL